LEKAWIDGAEIVYQVSGAGEPVVFIDGSFIAGTFRPLFAEPGLADRYQLILYHRRGYAGSSRGSEPFSVARQAADCRALLRHLGVERANVVGHSYGGAVALQLALDAPEVVHSLALLEPAIMVGESAKGYREALARGVELYSDTDAAVLIDHVLQARWPEYRAALDQALPGAFDQAVVDAKTSFEFELPGLLDWHFGETEARRIGQPALTVLGGDSEALWPRLGESHRLLLAWLAHAEEAVVPGTTHFMQVENPSGMA
jgi:pimeloyl-ACP methyl ester carboxylesterase